ncbi:MAG: hypothetical protein ABIJ96_14870 [Elusimicrobiota bacterium]
MNEKEKKKIRPRDLKLIALCAAALALSGAYIHESRERVERAGGGYRRVDLRAVQRLIRQGELVDREAMYYRTEARP